MARPWCPLDRSQIGLRFHWGISVKGIWKAHPYPYINHQGDRNRASNLATRDSCGFEPIFRNKKCHQTCISLSIWDYTGNIYRALCCIPVWRERSCPYEKTIRALQEKPWLCGLEVQNRCAESKIRVVSKEKTGDRWGRSYGSPGPNSSRYGISNNQEDGKHRDLRAWRHSWGGRGPWELRAVKFHPLLFSR